MESKDQRLTMMPNGTKDRPQAAEQLKREAIRQGRGKIVPPVEKPKDVPQGTPPPAAA